LIHSLALRAGMESRQRIYSFVYSLWQLHLLGRSQVFDQVRRSCPFFIGFSAARSVSLMIASGLVRMGAAIGEVR
jgi:hypothetical protein